MIKSNSKNHKNGKNKSKSNKKSSKKSSKKMNDNPKKLQQKEKKINNRVLELKTTQTGALKQVIERLSNFISDCCIVFIPPNTSTVNNIDDDYYEEMDYLDDDAKASFENDIKMTNEKDKNSTQKGTTGGIRIIRLTEDKSILVKVILDAANFEYFRCDEPKIIIGVDMHNFNNLLKPIKDDDPITLYMNKDNRSFLFIKSSRESDSSSDEIEIKLNLLELPNPEIPLPPTEFQNKITIASDKFHTTCKQLNNNSTHVELTAVNNQISLKGQNEGGSITITFKDINCNKKKNHTNQIVQGVYELKNLMGFSKCTKLCNTIDVYLKNNFPLVLVIAVATLGKMYVFLTPMEDSNY